MSFYQSARDRDHRRDFHPRHRKQGLGLRRGAYELVLCTRGKPPVRVHIGGATFSSKYASGLLVWHMTRAQISPTGHHPDGAQSCVQFPALSSRKFGMTIS